MAHLQLLNKVLTASIAWLPSSVKKAEGLKILPSIVFSLMAFIVGVIAYDTALQRIKTANIHIEYGPV